MDGADHDVELGEDFVGVIKRAIFEDVDFGANQNANAEFFGVGGAEAFDVFGHAFFVEAVGDRNGFGVVGDGDVFVVEGFGPFSHFLDGIFAIGRGGVHLKIALDVAKLDEFGKFVLLGGGNFTAIFAQFGWDKI